MPQPRVFPGAAGPGFVSLTADDRDVLPPRQLPFQYRLGARHLFGPTHAEALFTDNETNGEAVYGRGASSRSPYTKDAFHRHVVNGEDSTNPDEVGTKAALHYRMMVPPGQSVELCLRFATEFHPDPLAGVRPVQLGFVPL